jgi:hypothetical protein
MLAAMRAWLVAIPLVAGCGTNKLCFTPNETRCTLSGSLDGSTGNAMPTTFSAVESENVCLHLDASHNLVVGHFAATTDYMPGDMSTFTLSLVDPSGAVIHDGADVTVGQTEPQTFANLEWDLTAGQTKDVVLQIRGDMPTDLHVALFEPYE